MTISPFRISGLCYVQYNTANSRLVLCLRDRGNQTSRRLIWGQNPLLYRARYTHRFVSPSSACKLPLLHPEYSNSRSFAGSKARYAIATLSNAIVILLDPRRLVRFLSNRGEWPCRDSELNLVRISWCQWFYKFRCFSFYYFIFSIIRNLRLGNQTSVNHIILVIKRWNSVSFDSEGSILVLKLFLRNAWLICIL